MTHSDRAKRDYVNLYDHIKSYECYGDDRLHPFRNVFLDDDTFCQTSSSLDSGHLLFNIEFTRTIHLREIKFMAPVMGGPKKVKVFINQMFTNFSTPKVALPSAKLEYEIEDLTNKEWKKELPKVGRFPQTNSVSIFIESNHENVDYTVISHMILYGIIA